MSDPAGAPTLFLAPTWNGDLAQGENAIDQLHRLGTPLTSQVAPMSHPDMLGLFDADVVIGRHYAIRTRTVAGFTPDVVAACPDRARLRPERRTPACSQNLIRPERHLFRPPLPMS
jgi:hypothetical protein